MHLRNRTTRLSLIAGLAMIASSLAAPMVVSADHTDNYWATRGRETSAEGSGAEMGFRALPLAPVGTLIETGIASTYGTDDGFQGNLTACGQVFDTYVVQVAHKTLPCGTKLRVEDAETGKSVEAVVTDRGPYIRGRIVDLSWAAYKQLDPVGPGLRPVNVYKLD